MSRQFRFAPDPGGGSAGDVRLMFVVYTKATLQPGAGRARKARHAPLGWQPIPCLSQQRLGGRWKASPNFTRAARPERGEGDSQEEGEPSGSLSSCAPAARSGTSTHFGSGHALVRRPTQGRKRKGYHPSHIYPYPRTVTICVGSAGSSSILIRRRRIFTSTILSSPT